MNEFVRIASLLESAASALADVSDSPRLDAELLLARAIDMPRSYLVAHPDDSLDEAGVGRFNADLERRLDGEPMAYIEGEKEFWSLNLMVTPATLVPRPETELLVEQAIGWIPRRAEYDVLDLGTGSGAIAIAIARERPLCNVTATDISEEALAVACENARQNDLANLEFASGDWTAAVAGRSFDVIVSNPPYVSVGDPALSSLRFEPQSALVSGHDGLDDIRRIASEASAIVKPDGVLLTEHGADQSDAAVAILKDAGWQEVRDLKDLAGLPRVVFGRSKRSAQR